MAVVAFILYVYKRAQRRRLLDSANTVVRRGFGSSFIGRSAGS